MLVFGECYVCFAHPAEMCSTVQTLHVVTAFILFDWSHTPGTAGKLITTVARPLLKIQILAVSSRVPLLIALVTHLIRAVDAHRPVFAATGLFNC